MTPLVRQILWRIAVLGVVVGGAGCTEGPRLTATDDCASGLIWAEGDEGSELMHPGGDCVGCHSSNPDAPSFAIAGTVYLDKFAEDDCAGVEGAVVLVEDDDGQVLELTTNRAGNFFARESDVALTNPLRIEVRYQGRKNMMQEPVYNGNCHDCHSGRDAVRAPARVLAPQP